MKNLKHLLYDMSISIMKGNYNMPWWRKDSKEEDETFVEVADVLLDGASDADFNNMVKATTGEDLREQVTVEELEDWHKEAELRRFGWGRN